MKKIVICVAIFVWSVSCLVAQNAKVDKKITVACYYFPNYHIGDINNVLNKGANWSEWELVKEAKPRFIGHQQPKVPLWGYTDEKDPKVMAKKIKAAADNGIDVFIFDWYWYNGKPFLNRCLDEGFLKATNSKRLKFSLMWANHDWADIHPYTHGENQKVLYSGLITLPDYKKVCDYLVKKYFVKENYWKINGKAYFSIYDIQNFVKSFGSIEETCKAMNYLNNKAIEAGLKGVHWNVVAWGNPVLPVEKAPENYNQLIKILGFNSATSYVWVHHYWPSGMKIDYDKMRDAYFSHWEKAKKEYSVPYIPNATMGWDPSPRTNQSKDWNPAWGYPYSFVICNNTPENFRRALQMIKNKILASPNCPHIMNINCWNEWTEGSYLEPDIIHGMDYLKAVKSVFGSSRHH